MSGGAISSATTLKPSSRAFLTPPRRAPVECKVSSATKARLCFTFSLEQLQVAIAFGIGEIDLIDAVLVALLEDGGVVGLGHDHGDFILIGDSDGGLGDVAAKGSEQEMDFIHRTRRS